MNEEWVCRMLSIPGHLPPGATPTLSFSDQQLLESVFPCAGSVSWASHSPGRNNISFHWIDFLLFSGSDFIPEIR